ncbi:MAG: response regulator [Thermoanaerobaculia bacterium]|nr:response regulator [Thermoanaerobaculia bacterium]
MTTNLKEANILIVEDNDLLRGELASLLKEKGCRVEEAGNGPEALERMEKERFDVILLDLMLSYDKSKMQGAGLLRHLKTAGIETPVIVITNKASNEAILESFESGAGNVYAFLLKSLITPENILQIIENAIRFPDLTTDATRFLGDGHDVHVIRGIRSDLHYTVKEYVGYFGDYLKKFKGPDAEATLFSYLDDIFVTFSTGANRDMVMHWFREFLQYPLQYPVVEPVFETPVSPTESTALKTELKQRVKNLTQDIGRSFYSSTRDYVSVPVPHQQVKVFDLNGQKIFNNYALHFRPPSPLLRDFRLMEKLSQYAVSTDNTMEALEIVLNFALRYRLEQARIKTVLLMGRFNKAQEGFRQKRLDRAALQWELDAINGDILLNLLIDIERELGFA